MGQCDQDKCTTRVSSSDIADAVQVAKMADMVVVSVAVTSTEGFDRDNLTLGGNQDVLIEQVAAANPNTIVVVRCPGAVLMPWRDKVKAIIVQFLPGEQAGHALAAVLFGDVDPGGRLPVSFPATSSQTWLQSKHQYPGVSNGKGGYIATYTEELNIGYRWFDAVKQHPAFEFGTGMSYAEFKYENLRISGSEVSFDLKNTANITGSEVAQLYLSFPPSAGEPPLQLKGFRKVTLVAGASRRISLTLTPQDFSVWDTRDAGWKKLPGNYGVVVGASSRDGRLHGTIIIR